MRKRIVGFAGLPLRDRTEITRFFWLWSFFEGTHLGAEGDEGAIRALAQRWSRDGHLRQFPFAVEFVYFQNRYFPRGAESRHYVPLNMIRNRRVEPLVRQVLAGEEATDEDTAFALLMVIYRLRNNLVHGPKWAGTFEDQRDNFRHANSVLKKALELDGRGLLAL